MTKEFIQYLKDAIIIKGKVQVSGLGTFVGEYQSAQLVENNKLMPPAIILKFTENTSKEDENMASFLTTNAGITQEVAMQMVVQFVQDIKLNLASNRSAVMGDLGKLHYDVKQKLIFTPNEKHNFYAESAALESTMVQLNQNKSKIMKKQMEKKPVKKIKAAKPVEEKPVVDKTSVQKAKKLWPVWVALIMLFLAIPVLTIYLNKETPKTKIFTLIGETTKALWQDVVAAKDNLTKSGLFNENDTLQSSLEDVYADAELNGSNNETNTEYEETENTENTENATELTSEVNTTQAVNNQAKTNETASGKLVDKHYALTGIGESKLNEIKLTSKTELYLIAGSFKNPDNANRLKEELIGMGYQSSIVKAEGDLNRVTLGKFSTVDEALVVFKKFNAKRPEVGVWLLVRQ